MFDFNLEVNERPPKNGWWTGLYSCTCRNCNKEFLGSKRAWTCSDCAYDFCEQLAYEQLWRDLGRGYTAQYVVRKFLSNKQE